MASETDMRRLNTAAPRASDDNNHPADSADDDANNRSGAPLASSLSSQQPQPQRQQQRRPPPIFLPGAASLQPPGRESDHVDRVSNKQRRFSVLRFRNASDSQLSLRARQQADKPPPVPRT